MFNSISNKDTKNINNFIDFSFLGLFYYFFKNFASLAFPTRRTDNETESRVEIIVQTFDHFRLYWLNKTFLSVLYEWSFVNPYFFFVILNNFKKHYFSYAGGSRCLCDRMERVHRDLRRRIPDLFKRSWRKAVSRL